MYVCLPIVQKMLQGNAECMSRGTGKRLETADRDRNELAPAAPGQNVERGDRGTITTETCKYFRTLTLTLSNEITTRSRHGRVPHAVTVALFS
jgi:hypothetical protein